MAAPASMFQRAVFVAVPLALIALIFVTPSLVRPEGQPGPEEVPYLLMQVTGKEWNASVNETGLLYVRSPLGVPVYQYLAINVSGVNETADLTTSCGGNAAFRAGNWTCVATEVPSAWLKVPVEDRLVVNVTAVAVWEGRSFGYNTTLAYRWDQGTWVLREWPDRNVDRPWADYRDPVISQRRMEERR